jgi:hypothetical protein
VIGKSPEMPHWSSPTLGTNHVFMERVVASFRPFHAAA